MPLPLPSPARRLLAVILLALFTTPLITPLLALTSAPESNLPICCRRNGAHHCAAAMPMTSGDATHKLIPRPARCPHYPQPSASFAHVVLAAPTSALLFAEVVRHPSLHHQTEALARISLDRSRHKRGPPSRLT